MMATDPLDVVALAESYPYDLRDEAFTFRDGQVHPFDEGLLAQRRAVLAIGSNGAPQRLTAKFARDEAVPVLAAQLANHAVVYAATVTSYGSVPATFVPVTGAVALVAVTLLTDAQFERMNESESLGANYELVDVSDAVTTEPLWSGGPVWAYRSLFHPLRVNGQPLRMAEVPTVGTRFGAAYQSGVLNLLHRRFGRPGEDYSAFVTDLVASPERRLALRGALQAGVETRQRCACGA